MKRVRKIADEFATKMKVNNLPISLEDLEVIAQANNWNIIAYSKGLGYIKAHNLEEYYYTSKGFTYISSDGTIIFIKDDLEYLDKINVICHEIGHIVLKHIEAGTNQKSITCDNKDKIQELEADTFSLVFQSPTQLMQSLRIDTAHSLIKEGVFSKKNAKLRYKYYFQDVYLNNIGFKTLLCTSVLTIVALTTFNITKNHYSSNNEQNALNFEQIIYTTEITSVVATESTTAITETTEITTEHILEGEGNNETVYITKTGDKYHKQDCYYIKGRNTLAITLSEANNQGYLPCSVCYKKIKGASSGTACTLEEVCYKKHIKKINNLLV